MKSKIILLTIVLALAITSLCRAQQKPLDLSVKVYGGYGLFTPGDDKFFGLEAQQTDHSFGLFQPSLGYGSGVHAGAGLQLNLNKTITLGIDADYTTGSKNASASFRNDSTKFNPSSSHSVFSFIPNISFNLWSKPGYSVYNRVGVIVAVKTKLQYTEASSNYAGGTLYAGKDIATFKYGLQAGLQDAIGVQFNLAKNIKGFAEVSGYFLPVSPTSGTQVLVSGPASATTSPTPFTYHYTYKSSGTLVATNTATDAYIENPPTTQHISSIGINIGVIVPIH